MNLTFSHFPVPFPSVFLFLRPVSRNQETSQPAAPLRTVARVSSHTEYKTPTLVYAPPRAPPCNSAPPSVNSALSHRRIAASHHIIFRRVAPHCLIIRKSFSHCYV